GVLGDDLLDRHGARHDLAVDPRLADATGDELGVLRAEVDDQDGAGRVGSGSRRGHDVPSGGGAGACASRLYRGKPTGPSAPVSSRQPPSAPVSPSGPGWTRARGAAYLPPCSRTRPSSLPMATGPPAAMVVLLEPLTSDFPGAPGRQGPGRLRSSGPCRSGAPHPVQRGAPMTTTATPAAVPAAVPAASAAADGPAAVSPERTGARTAEAAELITGARERIDALDDRIIGLVQERIAVSAVI